MTVTFPLSYCGIEPLPEKFGVSTQHGVSVEVPESLWTENPSQTIMDDLRSTTSGDMPYFGHFHGNYQPDRDTTDLDLDPWATGGEVQNPKLAVSSIKNKDGIGAGKDVYKLYLGNGSTFPKKDQWVSFDDM